MKPRSIKAEAAACRAAWAAVPDATEGAHIHHETPFEKLTEPIEARIAYILSDKPKKEQALRLRLMRPVPAGTVEAHEAARASAWAAYQAARASAWAAYQAARASAWAAYDAAAAPAWATYQAARELGLGDLRGCDGHGPSHLLPDP